MRKTIIFLMVLAVMLPLAACGVRETDATGETEGTSAPTAPTPTEYASEYIVLSEPQGTASFGLKMDTFDTDGVTFAFESTVTREDREACIAATCRVFAGLGTPRKSVRVCVYSPDRYGGTYIREGTVYTHAQDWGSPEYLTFLLLGVFGEYCNYGAAYGYATYLSADATGTALPDAPTFPDGGDLSALDLNLLCFRDAFVTREEIACAGSVAAAFAKSYIGRYGADRYGELLADSGDPACVEIFSRALANYYAEYGLDYIPSDIRYAPGGVSFDYFAAGPYAVFLVENGWTDTYCGVNPLTYEGFLHENYRDVKRFFETNSRQMGQYRDLFAFESYPEGPTVYLTSPGRLSQTSFYQVGTDTVFLMNADSLMHEYIHALTASKTAATSGWRVEGVARYYSYRYDLYGDAMLNVDYNNLSDSPETLYAREYRERIGRDIDMAIDYREIENIAVYSRGYFDPDRSYASGSSFVGFLEDRFGERELIRRLYTDDGFPADEISGLVDEWVSYLNSRYADYSKYEK